MKTSKSIVLFISSLFVLVASLPGLSADNMPVSGNENMSDLTGLWIVSNRSLRGSRDEDFNRLESEEYLSQQGLEAIATVRPALDPSAMCLPSIPRHIGSPYPFEIVQNQNRVVQLFEYDNVFRIIYTDGREHPDTVVDQRYLGHAVGRWENGELIVDTRNYNGNAWYSAAGLPVSNQAHLTEWYSLMDDGDTLQIIVRYEDETYLTRPIWTKYLFNRKDDWYIREYFCAEGNRDNIFNQQGQAGALNAEDVLTE